MNPIIVLDTGVLGMLVHPSETGEPRECKVWLNASIWFTELPTTSVHRLAQLLVSHSPFEARRDAVGLRGEL